MKPAASRLGQALQQCLRGQREGLDTLAAQTSLSADALSNLIHGRRGFKDATLARLAATPLLQAGGLTLARLKALRAADAYTFEELSLAMLASTPVETLPAEILAPLQARLASIQPETPPEAESPTI